MSNAFDCVFSKFTVDFGVQFKHMCRSIAAASVGALGLPVFLVCAALFDVVSVGFFSSQRRIYRLDFDPVHGGLLRARALRSLPE